MTAPAEPADDDRPVRVDVEVDPAALVRIRAAVATAATDGLLDALSPAASDLAEQAYAAYVSAGGAADEWLPWDEVDDDERARWRAAVGAVARRVALRPARG